MTFDRTDLGLTAVSRHDSAGCACGMTGQGQKDAAAAAPVSTDVFVAGMTCSHCVASVTEELSAVRGVEAVSVDLAPGGVSRVTIRSAAPVDAAAIEAAVDEAGYALASAPA